MTHKICYCFNYSAEDIRNDVLNNNGKSTILPQIIAAKQHETCECYKYHPEKR